jgi:hypothetical protein
MPTASVGHATQIESSIFQRAVTGLLSVRNRKVRNAPWARKIVTVGHTGLSTEKSPTRYAHLAATVEAVETVLGLPQLPVHKEEATTGEASGK